MAFSEYKGQQEHDWDLKDVPVLILVKTMESSLWTPRPPLSSAGRMILGNSAPLWASRFLICKMREVNLIATILLNSVHSVLYWLDSRAFSRTSGRLLAPRGRVCRSVSSSCLSGGKVSVGSKWVRQGFLRQQIQGQN